MVLRQTKNRIGYRKKGRWKSKPSSTRWFAKESIGCEGRIRTSTGRLAIVQEERAGGQPLGACASYATFIPWPLPPRQEGMAAKVSSPHKVCLKLSVGICFFATLSNIAHFCSTRAKLITPFVLCNFFKKNLNFFLNKKKLSYIFEIFASAPMLLTLFFEFSSISLDALLVELFLFCRFNCYPCQLELFLFFFSLR